MSSSRLITSKRTLILDICTLIFLSVSDAALRLRRCPKRARPARPPAGHKPARGRADRISDPKIKTSIEIIIRTPYSGQVRETNGVDPPNIPMLFAGCGPTGFFLMVGWYGTTLIELNRPFKCVFGLISFYF